MGKKILYVLLVLAYALVISIGITNKCMGFVNNIEMSNIAENEDVDMNEDAVQEEITASNKYTNEELDLLSRIVFAEAGSDWLTDEHQRAVASVVLNRVSDSRFPNTIKDVVYQKGQYACIRNGMINKTPNQRAVDNAKYVLDNGVTIPENVVWQSQSKQGKGLWKQIQGHYFCY